jgi:ElaB/YqjD/DUF883 family membrane-anchored ribosome-binding protein
MVEAKGNGASGLHKTVDKNIESYSKTAHQAVDRAAAAAERVAESLGEKIDTLGEKRDELMELPQSWLEGARDYVREHPFQAVGVAVAAGYILSMMMRSRR